MNFVEIEYDKIYGSGMYAKDVRSLLSKSL